MDLTAGQTTYAHAISATIHAVYLVANWKLQAIDLQKLWEQGPAAFPPSAGRGEEQEMAIACGEVPSEGRYFVSGVLPPKETTCAQDAVPFGD